MKPTHYHTTFGFSAVTLYEANGITWTSDGYKAESVNVKPLSDLMGAKVTKQGWTGKIVGFLSKDREFVPGKYLPTSGRYGLKRKAEFYNAQAGVLWENNSNMKEPMPYYWNNFSSLKLLEDGTV